MALLTAFPDPDQEAAFQSWYGERARKLNMASTPESQPWYDFRTAFIQGKEPTEYDAAGPTGMAVVGDVPRKSPIDLKFDDDEDGNAPTEEPTKSRNSIGEVAQSAPLTDAQRTDALARIDNIQSRIGTLTEALTAYSKGYVTPSEMEGYRQLGGSAEDYARRVAQHGRAFAQGVALGEAQITAMHDNGFMHALSTGLKRGLGETVIGAGRLGMMAMHPQLDVAALTKEVHDKFDSEFLGLPTDPIQRAGYEHAFPWVASLLGDVGAFVSVAAVTGGMGDVAGVPRMLSAARGARGLVAINAAGAIGGGLIAASMAPEDHRMQKAVEGAAVGLGGTAMLSSMLAGRGIDTMPRLLRLQAMAGALEEAGVGGALRVAPRLTFGRMAMAGIEGAGYSTLTAMGQGAPVDKAIGQGVDEGLMFAGYDVAFMGLGRMAQWLPVHARIAETWASTAEALKLPSRLARAFGDTANMGLQAAPGAAIGGLLGGPVGAAIGGALTAAKAAKLQQELAITAARLRTTGALTEETVSKILTGQWSKLSAEEAESVTKALTKDVVERATVDLDPVLKYAVRESMGADAVLDNTELRALSMERGRVTQSIATMKAQGILEIDPQMVQASRRLAEIAERRNQVLLEEVNSMGAPGAVAEKVIDAQMRDLIETAGSNKGLILVGDVGAREAGDRLLASVKAAQGGERAVKGVVEPPRRILFRDNPTILRDLADAGLERAGVDAMLSKEGERALDALLAPQRRLALPAASVAPAGARSIKRPLESGMIGGALSRKLGGAAVGGAVGGAVDDDHPWRGAAIGAAAGLAGASLGERLLARSAEMRTAIERAPRSIERRSVPRGTSVPVSAMTAEERGLEEAYSRARAARTKLDPRLASDVQTASREGASAAEIDEIVRAGGGRPTDYAPLYERATIETLPPVAEYRGHQQGFGGKPGFNLFNLTRDIPGHSAGSTVSEKTLRELGYDIPPIPRAGEAGFARTGALAPIGAGLVGATVAPAIARHLGLLDEEDSVLTASAIGFMVAAGLGYRAISRAGGRLTEDAMRVAKFVQPTVAEQITPSEIARVIGKTGDEFKTTVAGKQVGGRRLYWALPYESQIAHTLSTIEAWPQRTTMKGKPLDMAARRTAFERDLARFAPFSIIESDWGKITDKFMASAKALGYTDAQRMRLYKGWLGWMTTPLEQRARTDIGKMSLDVLGRDVTNPFTTASGVEELRARATMADTITGPSQPLPRLYQKASRSLNKDGTPMAGRIRALVDDIESNTPSAAEGTADTIQSWWSAPGARSIAPTVRFYPYADRIAQSGDTAVGQLVHNVTRGIFEATESARVADDKDRAIISAIFRGINSPADMELVRGAVESATVRDSYKATNPRIYEAAVGVRKFLKERADAIGLPHMDRIEDYFPWVYNYRTKREIAEMMGKGIVPTDINYPIDSPVPRHVFFNHLESRSALAPLGQRVSPLESLMMYSHGANRKIVLDQLLANFGPETFQRIRARQPWLAHDLGRWLLDVVGVPGPGTMYVQKKVESVGLALEKFPMFQRPGLAQEINERYFLSPGGANNLSRLATGWAYTSKIAWNWLSAATNLTQQIINGGTEYGLLNVLTSSMIGASTAVGERVPVLAPLLDAVTPKGASYRKLLTERGILSETSQRHFDTVALYEAAHGTNRAHLVFTGAFAGAAAGAAGTAYLNVDRGDDEQLSLAGGALTGAGIASLGAAKSAIMRRALMRVRDTGTFAFNLAETWNRSTIGIAGVREARGAMRAATSPTYATYRRTAERVEGVITGAIGGAGAANLFGGDPATGALLGAAAAGVGATRGESRTARTQRSLAMIKEGGPIFENRVIRDQAKDALRPLTDDEVATLYAQMQTDVTQFRIAKEGRGYFLNTPHGQALGALQSYTLNQAEFVGGRLQSFIETASRAIAGQPTQVDFRVFRFASFVLGMGSVYGAILGGSHDAENDPDYWVSRLGFGVMPFLLWNDTARKWEVISPTDMFKGPLVGDIARTANSYMKLIQSEDANASFLDTTDKLVEQTFPGARNIIKARERREGASMLRMTQEGIMESAGGGQPVGQARPIGR